MSYKITKSTEAAAYTAPGHFDCRPTRLHAATDLPDGLVTHGITHFLPGGGAELAPSRAEMIYYILEGEMTVTLYDENDNCQEYVLTKGDSVHFDKGTKRGCKNTGNVCAQMMTIMIKPAFYQ